MGIDGTADVVVTGRIIAAAVDDEVRTVREVRSRLRSLARPESVQALTRFFKTGPGEYGEGDRFIGVGLPQLRMLCRECRGLQLAQIMRLLRSRVHEERLLALLILVDAFHRGSLAERRNIYKLYLAHTNFINNWDLVDSSAHYIVGGWLEHRSRAPLRRLARSPSLWERRIAIIATLHFIRAGEFDDTFDIADLLLADPHDLIHKAVGWMLREVGNRDAAAERRFLKDRYARMPRTMLRYAIEKFPDRERRRYLTRR
jgi:3-methyladenine DNA glycosylase AlkD